MSVMVVIITGIVYSMKQNSKAIYVRDDPIPSRAAKCMNTHLSHVIIKHVVVSHYQIFGQMVGEGEANTFILVSINYLSRCSGALPESLN